MRRFIAFFVVLSVLLTTAVCFAGAPVKVHPLRGPAPARMVAEDGDWVTHFVVENVSGGPVQIQELRLLGGDEHDPLLPRGMKVAFTDGSPHGRLAAGESKEGIVRWSPPKGSEIPEIHGHLLVVMEGHADVALGFAAVLHGQTGAQNPLLWWVLVPLLGAAIAFGVRGRGNLERQLVFVVAAAQLAIGIWLAARFDPRFTRFDGASGYQWLERVLLSKQWGIEYALGVDGVSLSWLFVVPLTLLAALGLGSNGARRVPWHWLLALCASVSFGVVTLDLALWLGSWLLAVLFVVLTLMDDAALAKRVGVVLGVGIVLVAVSVVLSSGSIGSLWLLDGSHATRSFSLIDLSHAAARVGAAPILGLAPMQVLYPLLLVGCLVLMGAAPLHGWLSAVAARASAPVATVVIGALSSAAGYGLLRVAYTTLPSGVRWAAPATCAVGALVVLAGALASWVQKDRRALVADAIAAQTGFVLLAVGGLTAIGVQGAIVVLAGRALLAPLLLGALGSESHVLGVDRGVGFAAVVALPGTVGFVGVGLASLGALPKQPVWAFVALAALVILGAQLHRAAKVGREGALPTSDALGSVAVAAVLSLLLGVWPHPWLFRVDAGVLDLAARVNPPGLLEVVRAPTSTERGMFAGRSSQRRRTTVPG